MSRTGMTEEEFEQKLEELKKPFKKEEWKWRFNSSSWEYGGNKYAKVVPYADRSTYIRRLNEVVGAQNWRDTYRPVQFKDGSNGHAEGIGGFLGSLEFLVDGEWISKEDSGSLTDGNSVKGGCTNTFKRSCEKWEIGLFFRDVGDKTVVIRDKQSRNGNEPYSGFIKNDGWYYFDNPMQDSSEPANVTKTKSSSQSGNGNANDNPFIDNPSNNSNSSNTNQKSGQSNSEFSRDKQIWFGKHKGTPYRDLPDDYLDWIVYNEDFNNEKAERHARGEIDIRRKEYFQNIKQLLTNLDIELKDIFRTAKTKFNANSIEELKLEDVVTMAEYLEDVIENGKPLEFDSDGALDIDGSSSSNEPASDVTEDLDDLASQFVDA